MSVENSATYIKLNDFNILDQNLVCPLKLRLINGFKEIKYDCILASGFYRIIQKK